MPTSRSSRSAWIEIGLAALGKGAAGVALLAERVDWNRALLEYSETGEASRSSRSAWIEIGSQPEKKMEGGGRAPRGARGLKCPSKHSAADSDGRAPRGARGLKFVLPYSGNHIIASRAPRGARGLKSRTKAPGNQNAPSRSSRSAWIEIQLEPLALQEL